MILENVLVVLVLNFDKLYLYFVKLRGYWVLFLWMIIFRCVVVGEVIVFVMLVLFCKVWFCYCIVVLVIDIILFKVLDGDFFFSCRKNRFCSVLGLLRV